MKKISKLVLTLPIAALSLSTVQASQFSLHEMDILNRTTPEDMRVVFNSVPALAGDRTLADVVNRLGGAPDDATLATIDGGGVAATIPAAITTLRNNIAGAAGAHAEADLALVRAVVTFAPGANALAEVNTVKTIIGTPAQFDAAQVDAAAAVPAGGAAPQFTNGTIGAAIGLSGTNGNEDAINEETRNLLRLAFRRLNTGIHGAGAVLDDAGALNDGNDSATGLGRATTALGAATENTLTLADLVRVLYAIRLNG